MKKFKDFRHDLNEGKFPLWVRLTVGSIVLKVQSLDRQIQKEDDPVEQNKLISQQNKLKSYITGLSVGIGSTDRVLLQRIRTQLRK